MTLFQLWQIRNSAGFQKSGIWPSPTPGKFVAGFGGCQYVQLIMDKTNVVYSQF